jgi:hypothetical protein
MMLGTPDLEGRNTPSSNTPQSLVNNILIEKTKCFGVDDSKKSNLICGNFMGSLTTVQSVRSLSFHKKVQEFTVLSALCSYYGQLKDFYV